MVDSKYDFTSLSDEKTLHLHAVLIDQFTYSGLSNHVSYE
jgi:hypothetical protein